MELIILSPSHGHTATCLYLNIQGTGILIDAGLDPMLEGEAALPDLAPLHQNNWPVDWILISHAHIDHMGALPVMARHWPNAGIICTEITWDLLKMQLSRFANLQNDRFYSGELPDFPLFGIADVQDLVARVQFIRRGERILLDGGYNPDKIPLSAFDAGHILGSCGYLIEENGKKLFYTGDTCGRPQSVIQGAVYPQDVDTVITEATIAWSDNHVNLSRKNEITRLATDITEVDKMGGNILIPVFNMGRAQEILFILHHLKRKGRIPPLPVLLGRSAWEIASVYDKYAAGDRRLLPDFLFSETLIDIVDSELINDSLKTGGKIFLVPSGMLSEGSNSWELAQQILPHPIHAIFFVGHASTGSLGKDIINSKNGEVLNIGGKDITLHCRVESYLFSSHSNRNELQTMIGKMNPSEVIILNGRKDSNQVLADAISESNPDIFCLLPEPGHTIELSN
jgi:cleavage and polyadenylation specificity factor subunit 3